jgi:hypothetical protein
MDSHKTARLTPYCRGLLLLSRPLVSLARFLQLHFGVGSQRKQTLLAAVAVLEAPPSRSVWIHEYKEATTVEELPRFLSRLRRSDSSVGQFHGGIRLNHTQSTPRSTPTVDRLPVNDRGHSWNDTKPVQASTSVT